MKNVLFQEKAYEQFMDWLKEDEDIFWKINALIQDISRDYFRGLGKPEPLKHNFQGYWSRRITDEHRLIYKIKDDVIIITRCKGHYKS